MQPPEWLNPKAFISYSWTSLAHRVLVLGYAERLLADGVDVVFDQYDLREGQEKYQFVEKMVTDSSVTHVLAFFDRAYAENSDARRAGVGTESQIVSKEIYDKVDQTKFIPIACELDERGEPYFPQFFKNRIALDFSSLERARRRLGAPYTHSAWEARPDKADPQQTSRPDRLRCSPCPNLAHGIKDDVIGRSVEALAERARFCEAAMKRW
jgi:TIR domain